MLLRKCVLIAQLSAVPVLFAEPSDTLEVIEVTAQKRIESIQQVPISLSVLSNAQLNNLQIDNAEQLGQYITNLNVTRSIGGQHNYFIRGIGMDDFNLSSVSAIGLYIDDVALQNPMLSGFTLHDINRVEVLRGPQNTLYGKNTTGGAVKLMTPSPRLNGYHNGFVKLTVGQDNLLKIDLATDIQFASETAARMSVFQHLRDGTVTSRVEGNNTKFNDMDRLGLRFKLLHQFNGNWQLLSGINLGQQRQVTAVKTPMAPIEGESIINLDKIDLSYNGSALRSPKDNIDFTTAFIKFQGELNWFKFSSITAFEQVKSERMDDWGSQGLASSIFQTITYNTTDTQHYSQEFQLQSADTFSYNWLAGVLIDHSSGDLLQAAYIDPGSQGRPDDAVDDAGGGPLFDRAAWLENDVSSFSVYGQYDQHLADKFNYSIGLRWTRQQLSPDVHSAGMMMDLPEQPFPLGSLGWYSLGNPNFQVLTDYAGKTVLQNFVRENDGFAATARVNETFNQWGGHFKLSYQLSTNKLVYASASRGFKMGAVNSNPTTAAFQSTLNRIVQPEELITYELGWKSQFLEDQLRINGAVFKNVWLDYQFFQVYNPGNPAQLFASLINLPQAQAKGAEVEIDWLLPRAIAVRFGIAWLDTQVTDGHLDAGAIPPDQQEAFQNQVVTGNQLTNAPKWTLNSTLSKEFFFANSELNLKLHYHYKGKYHHTLAGQHTDVWQSNFSQNAFGLLNFSAKYYFGQARRYSVNIWGRNILDEPYCSERAAVPGTATETVRLCAQGADKSIGVTAVYEFD
ncbi:TonB-dependent receptor [Catenovulum sediminis]|uniref:TonB-dependent receptor n=1 Tax=Catenovulum sediminis TaxID=1740262 RepID=A0ABV1RDV6_9ALTE